MREVLFKDLTSVASRKKDILLKEIFERDGVVAKTERRCFYFIKNISRMAGPDDPQAYLDSNSQNTAANKRTFHILKLHNDQSGEDKLIFKLSGTFYAVVDNALYTIAFLHSFKVKFMKVNFYPG